MDKLRIFISGTQDDMRAERDAVGRAVEAVSLAESVRAEQTLSRPRPPKDWIVEQIQSCDIYLGVYGHRYGWVIPEEGVSATEFEFDLAVRYGKPVLAWVRKRREAERGLPDLVRQQQFLARVSDFNEGYVRQEFERPEELERWVADALRQTFIDIIRRSPAPSHASPPPYPLIHAYLEELVAQRPYVLWDDEAYIERDVAQGEDYFSRIVTPFDPRRTDRGGQVGTEPIEDALERERKLILLGEPGLGKTTSLLHLTWDSATRACAAQKRPPGGVEVPVYIELKYYNGEVELEALIARRLNDILRPRRQRVEPESVRAWLGQPGTRLLLLLDGLNEVRPDFHTEVRGLLQPWLGSPHRVVVACRERDYDYSLRDQAPAYVLQGLQENEIRDYLRRNLGAAGEVVFDEQIRWDSKMRTLAGNPLMLWLVSNVVLDESGARLPTNRGKLFQKFIGLMPRLRASEKFGTKIPVYVVTGALSKLGFEMQQRGVLTADLATAAGWCDPSPGWRLEDVLAQAKEWRFLKSDGRLGERIEFLHQLFLEYFAAAQLDEFLRGKKGYARVLGEKPFGYRWHEITVMLAGIHERPVDIVKWLGEQVLEKAQWHAAFLVERCWETTEAHQDDGCRRMLIKVFAEALKAEGEDTRKGAAESLGRMRDARAAGCLVAALRDPSIYVSRGAAKALAEINPPVSEPLVALLSDRDAAVRMRAVEVLANIGDARAVSHLVAALKDEDIFVRREASEALAKRNDRRVVAPLVSALGDADTLVKSNAADGLGNIGDPRTVGALAALLDEEEFGLGRRVAAALAKIGTPAVETLVSAARAGGAAARRHAAEALGKTGDARAVEALAEALRDEDLEVRTSAADALAEIGVPSVDALVALLSDEDADVRTNALTALGGIHDERAVAPLLDALRNQEAAAIRRVAAEALYGNAGPGAVEPLIAALYDVDAQVALHAAEALVKIGAPAVGRLVDAVGRVEQLPVSEHAPWRGSLSSAVYINDILLKIGAPAVEPLMAALKDPERYVRISAADTLERIGDPRCVGAFLAALHDDDKAVRGIASDAVLELSGPDDMGALAEALKDPHVEARRVAARALAKLGGPAVWHLVTVVRDEDDEVRKAATGALKDTHDQRCEDAFVEALADDSPSVRADAAAALKAYDSSRVTDALLGVINDRATDVRHAALSGLRGRRDQRVVQALTDVAINDPDDAARGVAVKALAGMGASGVEALGVVYRMAPNEEKWHVMRALPSVGAPAVGLLIQALGDDDGYVRSNAAFALGEIGDAQAIQPLIGALGDVKEEVRMSATGALAKLGPPAVQPIIDAALERNNPARRNAADALEAIRDPRCVDAFVRLLQDEDVYMRQVAASALYHFGDARSTDALVAALDDDDQLVRTNAARAMRFLGDPRAAPRLAAALADEDEKVRHYVTEGLVRIGSPAVDSLIEAWRGGNTALRRRAVLVLREIADPRAVEPLVQALQDGYAADRDGIIDALVRLGEPAAAPLAGLLQSGTGDTRAAAVVALARMSGDGATALLADALRDPDVHVRRLAAIAVRGKAASRLVEPLIEALHDPDVTVRKSAATVLMNIGAPAVERLIVALRGLKREPESDAPEGGASPRPAGVESLLATMKDPASHTRRRAREGRPPRLDPSQLADLALALEDPDPEVRHHSGLMLKAAGRDGVKALIIRLLGEERGGSVVS